MTKSRNDSCPSHLENQGYFNISVVRHVKQFTRGKHKRDEHKDFLAKV